MTSRMVAYNDGALTPLLRRRVRDTGRRHDGDAVDDVPVILTDEGDLGDFVGDAVAAGEYHPLLHFFR